MRKLLATVAALFVLASALVAQQEPYVEASPDEFLTKARTAERPALVLFNFNLKSG